MACMTDKMPYLYYLYDTNLSYFQYKSYSFSVPGIDVKEQTLRTLGAGWNRHTNPVAYRLVVDRGGGKR